MAITLFALLSFAFSNLMCSLNVKCSSKVIQTYFTQSVADRIMQFNFTLEVGIADFLSLKYISSVFVAFNEILLASNQ